MGATKLMILLSFLGIFTCTNNKAYEERVNLTAINATDWVATSLIGTWNLA